ncbi:MAG TPA: substrate-binding domain-containing protein, partial [Acidimicrobiales bacterium]|nr:substrate-binding domain-containing protein [Acidimicrobiales bacterium]
SASMAVQHLVNLGHERIAIISGDPKEPVHFTVPLSRRVGYCATLTASGIPVNEELEAHGPFSVDGGDEATVQLLSRRVFPTAIFAECDEMAFGVLRALRRVGLRAPADVSVIGFDDHPMAPYLDLTTVAQDVREQGRQIAAHLVEAVSRSSHALRSEPVELEAGTRLVVRGTTSVVGLEGPGMSPLGGPYATTDGWRSRPTSPQEARMSV